MTTIDRASALLKSGDRAGAQKILLADLKNNPRNIEAILLLAKTTDSEKQKRLCYERALVIDSANLEARNGLKRLEEVASLPMPKPVAVDNKSVPAVKSSNEVEQPKPPKVQKPSSQSGYISRTLILFVIVVILIGCLLFTFFLVGMNVSTSVPKVNTSVPRVNTSVPRVNTPSLNCCKHCGSNSKPCGDTCISLNKNCSKIGGCACP